MSPVLHIGASLKGVKFNFEVELTTKTLLGHGFWSDNLQKLIFNLLKSALISSTSKSASVPFNGESTRFEFKLLSS